MTVARRCLAALGWLLALWVPACAQTPTPVAGMSPRPSSAASAPATTSPAAGCEAARAQAAVGQPGTSQLAEWARVQAGARSVRLIGHDEMVTKEYNSTRLNLQLDEGRRVARVYCG